jgi:hypothetical protein
VNLFDLIRHPHAYFEALSHLPPAPWRFAWLPALAGLVGGVSQAFLTRPVLEGFSLAFPMLPSALIWVLTILISVIGSLLLWLVLWGVGQLGAGKGGRSGEVYAVTFLAPLLWAAVLLVLALITPTQIKITTPNFAGLELTARLNAFQSYSVALTTQLAALPLVRFSGVMGYAIYVVQFWLAYIGFRVMTASRVAAESAPSISSTPSAPTPSAPTPSGQAWKGVMYPAGLLLVLGLAGVLLAAASLSLAGAPV